MSAQAGYDPIAAAFQQAVNEFKASVKDEVYQQILVTKTIDDVYDATDKLQKEQAKTGHLRHLRKIEPFLENLREYAAVIEVFLQSKPDVLALIWGPVKLLLQWTNALKQSFDAITSTLCEIGHLLPEFKKMASLFENKPQINHVLLLFFKDILQFYAIALKFFGLPRWNLIFESMWPRRREQIKVVMENIERHKLLLRNEVRLEDIEAAHQARLRAYQHFEAAEKAHRYQEYQATRQYVSPKSYAAKLNWLDLRVCPGTEKWLAMDAIYRKWIDVTDLTSNLLWLQGIPGAGKTFLSGLVAKKAIQTRMTAYAFLSYSQADSTSALSVLQSLLFHLAEDNEDVQEAVCRSSRTNLKSDMDLTFDLLVIAIALLGVTFLIVDGLDEMQEWERRVLLKQLLRLNETCKEAKILVSSRAESDISMQLKEKPTIRVDSHNTAGIERFVLGSTDEWFRNSWFSADMQSEIRTLLAPLPSSSKGMFLYARIVLDSVKELDDLEDIRSELRVLPENLDEAYARVFARINKSKPVFKQKARKLLSWIGCSPTPITIQELEAALLIKYDGNDTSNSRDMAGVLDVTKFCGPIVEVVDEFVQFVHFTVKEYIFSPRIPEHINISDATLELAICCIFYLRQYHHDMDRTDDAIVQSLLSGSYRLHTFAKTTWHRLVEAHTASMRPQQISPRLLDQLELFVQDRSTHWEDAGQGTSTEKPKTSVWSFLEINSPQIHNFLCAFGRFNSMLATSEFSIDKADWTHLDPTSTSRVSVRLHQTMDELLRGSPGRSVKDDHAAIQRYYGRRPFKCKFVGCAYHKHGFESRGDRKAHSMNHECPWTCSMPDCEFASSGFLSRKMRDGHMDLCHSSEKSAKALSMPADGADSLRLVLDLIEADQVEHLRALLLQDSDFIKKTIRKVETSEESGRDNSALKQVSKSTARVSLKMCCLVHEALKDDESYYRVWQKALTASAEAGNSEVFQYVTDEYPSCITSRFFEFHTAIVDITEAVLSSDDMQIFEAGYASLQKLVVRMMQAPRKSINRWRRGLAWTTAFTQVANQDEKQSGLLRIWKLLVDAGALDHGDLNDLLLLMTQRRAPARLAEFCLDEGANVDTRAWKYYPTPLHYAARRSSVDAAAMVKLLLIRGADPDADMPARTTSSGHEIAAKRIRDGKGAREIHKWLGKTWDELVAETEQYRRRDAKRA